MIKINLLPHREARRKRQRAAFVALMALGAVLGVVAVLMVGAYNATRISIQEGRNRVIADANAALDVKIQKIAGLKQEIEALQARQQAVEDLQGDRNQPVYLLDELVRQIPEGVYLKAFKQEGQNVTLSGYAQSQERVAELLRNLAGNSQWLERPDLTEVRAVSLDKSKSGRKVVEFTLSVNIKRPRDIDAAAEAAAGAPAAGGRNSGANNAAPAGGDRT